MIWFLDRGLFNQDLVENEGGEMQIFCNCRSAIDSCQIGEIIAYGRNISSYFFYLIIKLLFNRQEMRCCVARISEESWKNFRFQHLYYWCGVSNQSKNFFKFIHPIIIFKTIYLLYCSLSQKKRYN